MVLPTWLGLIKTGIKSSISRQKIVLTITKFEKGKRYQLAKKINDKILIHKINKLVMFWPILQFRPIILRLGPSYVTVHNGLIKRVLKAQHLNKRWPKAITKFEKGKRYRLAKKINKKKYLCKAFLITMEIKKIRHTRPSKQNIMNEGIVTNLRDFL